jgi:thiol-disulfide isomerase/thioredoxin
MLSWKRLSLIVAVTFGTAGVSARAQSLGIGDPAPKLEVKSFVKGDPVTGFEPGKNYVVEFWATWCGPCRTSIPHLTDQQKKHPEVTFIGVSVWEQDPGLVKPFVEQMGDKMGYRVAMDAIPEGKKGNEGAMAISWMKAAGRRGIPSAFIINGKGNIAWMGHPMSIDEPLEKIISGSWDLNAAAEEHRREVEAEAKMAQAYAKLNAARRGGDPKKLLTVIDELVAETPALEQQLGLMKLPALIKVDEQDKALDLAKKLEQSALGKSAGGLNALAWAIVDPDAGLKPNAKLVQFALEAARLADEKSEGKSSDIADTLAKAYFDSGNATKALEAQERAVRLIKESKSQMNQKVLDRLEQYKKAASQN